jgi:hypothetical protein
MQRRLLIMGARGEQCGTVKSPSGQPYYYYWNESTHEVHVGNESAGHATSKEEALRKARFYATTCQQMR